MCSVAKICSSGNCKQEPLLASDVCGAAAVEGLALYFVASAVRHGRQRLVPGVRHVRVEHVRWGLAKARNHSCHPNCAGLRHTTDDNR